jgi:hypothetical protein
MAILCCVAQKAASAAQLLLLLVTLLLLASRLWQAFLLLLAAFKFLIVSCCWSLCYWSSWCNNGVVGISAVPFEHAVAGGPAVTGFSAVDRFLSVASIPDETVVPILACGFTY